MTDRQKKAWIAIMGRADFPTSRAALMAAVRPAWERLKEHNPWGALDLFDDAEALYLYDAANDPIFGIDWEDEQT